jgi:hypothetical protein
LTEFAAHAHHVERHTGIVTVERVGRALLWTYPGRRVRVR